MKEHDFTAEGRRIVESIKGYVVPVAETVGNFVAPTARKVKPALDKLGPVFARMSATNKRVIAILGVVAAAGTGSLLCSKCVDTEDQVVVVPTVPAMSEGDGKGRSDTKNSNMDIRSNPVPGGRKIAPEHNEFEEVLVEGALKTYKFDNAEVTAPWYWLLTTARAEGWKGGISTKKKGLRTYKEQKFLWNEYKAGRGAGAFNPDGPNVHKARHLINSVIKDGKEWHIAIDTDEEQALKLIEIAEKHGVILHRPHMRRKKNGQLTEQWHVEAKKPFSAPDGFSLPGHANIHCLDKKGNLITNDCVEKGSNRAEVKSGVEEVDEVVVVPETMAPPDFDIVAEAARARSLLKDIETYNHVDSKANRRKSDESFNIILTVRRNDSSKIEYVTLKPDGRATKGFKVTRGKRNGVNTAYLIEEPKGFYTLAIKRVKNVAGINREIVYSPYSPKLDTPEVRRSGADYLNSLIYRGKEVLDMKKIKSDIDRKASVASTVPDRLIFTIALIEHMDYFELKRGKTMEDLAKRTLAIIGLNGRNSYDYVHSDAGARGLFQLMPDTYRQIDMMNPDAQLKDDHVAGSMDHMNAVQTAIILTDHNMDLLANNDKNLAEIMKDDSVKRGMLLAAVYNGGLNRPLKAYKEHGDDWMNHLPEETRGYVEKFVAVMKLLEEGKLP